MPLVKLNIITAIANRCQIEHFGARDADWQVPNRQNLRFQVKHIGVLSHIFRLTDNPD